MLSVLVLKLANGGAGKSRNRQKSADSQTKYTEVSSTGLRNLSNSEVMLCARRFVV